MTNDNGKRRALMWTRINAAGSNKSLAEQEEAIRKFAEEHGLEVVGSVGGVFSGGDDALVSAKVEEVILRKDSEEHRVLLFSDWSRFSRLGLRRSQELLERLRCAGIEAVAASGPL